MDKIIGNFRCTGKGYSKPGRCKSLLQVTWGDVYIQHDKKSHITFTCPRCFTQTNIKYSKYRAQQPPGVILPSKTEYYIANGFSIERVCSERSERASDVSSCRRWV